MSVHVLSVLIECVNVDHISFQGIILINNMYLLLPTTLGDVSMNITMRTQAQLDNGHQPQPQLPSYDIVILVMNAMTLKYEIRRRAQAHRCKVYTIGVVSYQHPADDLHYIQPSGNIATHMMRGHATDAFDYVSNGELPDDLLKTAVRDLISIHCRISRCDVSKIIRT
jgi:hypothetical protein